MGAFPAFFGGGLTYELATGGMHGWGWAGLAAVFFCWAIEEARGSR